MLINNIITYLYIERKPEQHEIFRRNLHILESNLWNAIQSEVFRIAWHSQRLCPTGRLFDAGRSETDSGSAGLSAPCLSRRTRSTENIPRSDSENEGHAKKKNIKNEADKSHMRPACFLLWYAQHGRRSVVKTNARSVVRFLFQFCEDTDILQCRKFRLFPSR